MSAGSGVTPFGMAPSRVAKIGVLPGGMPAPVNIPLPSEPTIAGGCSGSRAPRPALVCADACDTNTSAATAAKISDSARVRAGPVSGISFPPTPYYLAVPILLASREANKAEACSLPETRIDTALCRTLIIMSMQAESLEVLEKADVAPAQARAIVRAIEIELAGAKETLATKQDLLHLRQELRSDMADLRGDLRAEIH